MTTSASVMARDRISSALDGQLLVPGAAGYDDARSVWNALVEHGAGTSWDDPAKDQARIGAARRCAAALDPYASGAYVNFVNDEGAEGVLRAYSAEKLTRLTAMKDAYDPDNVFHLNHNIKPAAR